MAGHSKWADIQRRRGERPVGRATGEAASAGIERVRYEGYGPGGVAVIADCQTADRSRSAAEVRGVFARYGGALGAMGAVSYLFNEVGMLLFAQDEDARGLTAAALEAGAEDVLAGPDRPIEVLSAPADFAAVRAALAAQGFKCISALRSTLRAADGVALDGATARATLGLLEALERLEGVENVYTNAEISDTVLARVPA